MISPCTWDWNFGSSKLGLPSSERPTATNPLAMALSLNLVMILSSSLDALRCTPIGPVQCARYSLSLPRRPRLQVNSNSSEESASTPMTKERLPAGDFTTLGVLE